MANETILVVDDNTANLALMRILLEKSGYRTVGAGNAEGVIKFLSSEAAAPQLILMDIHLPGMDGLALTRALKSDPSTRGILVVAITGYALQGEDERALAAGCDDFIAKPISPRMLVALVSYHLAKRRAGSSTAVLLDGRESAGGDMTRPADST